jgi:HAE1 family hydrophobic/amphiphilic exporter-1
MEAQVAQPIEEVVNTIEGIKELRSVSGAGSSFVVVTFELDRDIDTAAQDVRDRVATVVRDLPRDTDPPTIAKADTDQSPVMSIALSGNRSQRELTELADKIVKTHIERAPGVGQVDVIGALERAINVWVDADRLSAYRIPITEVREAVERQNANTPGGNVTGALREQTLRTMGRLRSAREFNELVIATREGAPIRVRDVGWAEDGTKEQRSFSRLDGVPAVSLDILRQSGANTVAVIEAVKAKLAELGPQLPEDVKLEVIRDQSRYIYEALHEIRRHLVLGSCLASLVVLAFMRNLRATFIAAVAIPTSVIATFGMMKALDFTLNSVTMLALVLMVGIVIDDAIVVLENIFRFVEERRMRPFEAARAATAEIGLAVMATTFSLVVIFVPVSFMSSISGRFLYQFGLTAAVAVLTSLLVSFTLTPMMSARLLRGDARSPGDRPASRRGFYARLDAFYTRVLGTALRWRFAVAALALLIMATAVPLYNLVRQEYLPSNVDEGEFDVRVTAPEGAGLEPVREAALRIEHELRSLPGVRHVLASAGGGFLGGMNSANFYVRLAPHEERAFRWRHLAAVAGIPKPLLSA